MLRFLRLLAQAQLIIFNAHTVERKFQQELNPPIMSSDQVFVKYLSEIERIYIALPKAVRIRVERWVDKLVSVGYNDIWKRHRNSYAKLLLNMIVNRNLESPFNVFPPEGPIPAFPVHLRASSKHLLGVHETSFWRDLYGRMQGSPERIRGTHRDVLDNSLLSSYRDESMARSIKSMTAQATSEERPAPPPSFRADSPVRYQLPLSREISNLNLLIQEQSHRIKLLEEQLNDERTKNELHIQRLHYSHRMEVAKLKSETEALEIKQSAADLHDLPPSYYRPSASFNKPNQSYDLPNQSYDLPDQSYDLPQPSYDLSQPSYYKPSSSNNKPQPSYDLPQPSYDLTQPSYNKPQSSYDLPQTSYNKPQPSYDLPQQSYNRPQTSYDGSEPSLYRPPSSEEILPPLSYDLTPQSNGEPPSADLLSIQQEHGIHEINRDLHVSRSTSPFLGRNDPADPNASNSSDIYLNYSSESKQHGMHQDNEGVRGGITFDIAPTPPTSASIKNKLSPSGFLFQRPAHQRDDAEFLKYIDNFQSDLRRISDNLPLVAEDRF